MTPLLEYLFNEASSGTGPTNLLNSGSAGSSDLPITYGSGNWASIASGRALALASGTKCDNTAVGSAVATALSGSKTISCEFLVQITTLGATGTLSPVSLGVTTNCFGVDWRATTGGPQVYWQTVADGAQEASGSSITGVVGTNVVQYVLDTAATNRVTGYLNGFSVFTTNTNITANTTLDDVSPGNIEVESAYFNTWAGAGYQGYGAFYSVALTGADCLAHALRLFADSDHGPNATGAHLRQAGTNGGANDASSATTVHTVAPTQTVAASGKNRGLFALITGFAVSTGVTACTFNSVSGTKVTGQTDSLSSLADAEVWWWNDAALPSAAGNYSASITVDGATGTAAATLHYMEGVSQSVPTNFGATNGTGMSITATLAGNAASGSIVVGVLFDLTTTDAAADGSNQLPVSSVNGTGTGNTHKHQTSAKYVPIAGSNSMSWSGLTNATGKIAVAVEVPLFPAGGASTDSARMSPNSRAGSPFRLCA